MKETMKAAKLQEYVERLRDTLDSTDFDIGNACDVTEQFLYRRTIRDLNEILKKEGCAMAGLRDKRTRIFSKIESQATP